MYVRHSDRHVRQTQGQPNRSRGALKTQPTTRYDPNAPKFNKRVDSKARGSLVSEVGAGVVFGNLHRELV